MQVRLLNREYTLASGRDAVSFLALMADTLNQVARDVVRIGTDTLTTATKVRANGEWLRLNWSGAGGQNNAALPAALLAAMGSQQQVSQRPLTAPQPQPPADPHKSTSSAPTLTKISPEFVAASGSVSILAPPSGPQATDRTFWVKVTTADSSGGQGQPLCSVVFGTPYGQIPTVQATVSSASPAAISPVNIKATGFDLVASIPLPPRQDVTVMLTVTPSAGDPSF